MYPFFYFNSNIRLLIYLVSTRDNKAIHAFPIHMPEVEFIGNDLSLMKIKKYPIILLEYLNGFYTTTDYIDNVHFGETSLNESKIFSDFIMVNQYQRKVLRTPKDIILPILREQRYRYDKTTQELETIKAQYTIKHEELLLLLKQNLDKIKSEQEYNSSNEISKKREKLVELIKTKNNLINQSIAKLKTLNKSITDRVKVIEEKIDLYNKRLIVQKEKKPRLSFEMAFSKKVNKIYIKKFLSEYAFIFFNQRLCKYITLPPFYNEPFLERNKIKRLTYFENNEKKISLFLGFIAQMITYLSKTLNIPMRYPLFVHGASSSLVKAVK